MTLYRNKPTIVEAKCWSGEVAHASEIIGWVLEHGGSAAYYCGGICDGEQHLIRVHGMFGPEYATQGDYVVRLPDGQWRVLDADTFTTSFEPILP